MVDMGKIGRPKKKRGKKSLNTTWYVCKKPPVQRELNLEFDGAHADIVAVPLVTVPPVSPEQAAKEYYQLMMQQHGPEAMIMLQEAARYLIGCAPTKRHGI